LELPGGAIEELVQATTLEMRLLTASLLSWLPIIDANLAPLVAFAASALCHHELPQLSMSLASALLLLVLDMGFNFAAASELRRLSPRYGNMTLDVRNRLRPLLWQTPYFEDDFARRSGLPLHAMEPQARDMHGLLRIYGTGIAPEYSGGLSRSELTDEVERVVGAERRGRRLVDHVRDELRSKPLLKDGLARILETNTPRVQEVWGDDDWLIEILRSGLGEEGRRAVDYERSLLKNPQQIAAHVLEIGGKLRQLLTPKSPAVDELYGPEVGTTKDVIHLFKVQGHTHVELALRALANLNRA
jgi:hypothetical protein